MTFNIMCLDDCSVASVEAKDAYEAMILFYKKETGEYPAPSQIQGSKCSYWLRIGDRTYGVVHKKPER